MHRIKNILSANELDQLNALLEQSRFVDGRATLGSSLHALKANLELDPKDPKSPEADALVRGALSRSREFIDYAFPYKISGFLFNRYEQGMRYDGHNDNAISMGHQMVIRHDLSFTIFLSAPQDYEGGELVVTVADQEHAVKFDRGDMAIYPSGLIHRVNEVTAGCRNAVAGFMQSTIPQNDRRELVYKLQQVKNQLLQKDGKTEHYEALEYVYSNLQRMWIQV